MRKKSFKKECPSCKKFYFDDSGATLCKWGKGPTSKPKALFTQKSGKIKPCNLLREK